jgi:hypothetical protein
MYSHRVDTRDPFEQEKTWPARLAPANWKPAPPAEAAGAKKPYYGVVSPNVHLGYRRTQTGSGRWVVRAADGAGGYWTKAFALADDYEPSDGARTS